MKVIVIGSSLSGKTTLVKYLRSVLNLPIAEMDEKLVEFNGGMYPSDIKYKHDVLAPKIIKNILSEKDTIFFTGTDYFALEDLKVARDVGFKIILLSLDLEELSKRNKERMRLEGYEDMGKWFGGMLRYQQQIQDEHLVDQVIDANLPVEKLADDLLKQK